MLSHVKIGTKLTCGFVAVLVLLVVVWLVGRYSINQKTVMYSEVDNSTALAREGMTVSLAVSDTMVALGNMVSTHEEQYAKEVQDLISKTIKEHEGAVSNMTKQESKDKWKIIIDNLYDFSKGSAQYWEEEGKRLAVRANRSALATTAQNSIQNLADKVRESTKSEKWAKTVENESYIPAHRLDLQEQIVNLALILRETRIIVLQYESELDNAKQEKLLAQIKDGCDDIQKRCDEIKESVSSEQNKALVDIVKKDITAWQATVQETTQLVEHMEVIIDKTKTSAVTANNTVDECIDKLFDTRAAAAREDSANFDNYIQWVLTVTSLIAIVLGVVVCIVLTGNITSGLKRSVTAMKAVADEGDVTIEIANEDLNRYDEIGDMTKACAAVLHQFQNVEKLAEELAAGNYNVTTKVRGDKDSMNIYLNKMLDQTNNALHGINEGVGQVATGSGEVSNAAQSLSSGAQEAAASLEEITASMSEISGQTKKNAEGAGQARDLANKASQAAAEGQHAMKEMTSAMERITQNSTEIQRVIKVIDDIAFQTNLLALNAAVEAARAGQHGKGFAVVAEEVRNLASRSAKAARETSELIAKSGHEIEKGGEVAAHTAGVLDTIVDQIKQTTDLVGGIATASNEQAQGVNQVTIGLQQIDSVTQQNTAAAEESASAANEMSSMAVNLQKLVAQFKLRP